MDYASFRPYVPKTDRAEWASRASHIRELYDELLPVIKDIQKRHPESICHMLSNVDAADGFTRLTDFVPNVQNVATLLSEKSSPLSLERLRDYYAPKTDPIFKQVNAMLKQYLSGEENWEARREALRISDDLEWALKETYQAAETMQGKQKRER